MSRDGRWDVVLVSVLGLIKRRANLKTPHQSCKVPAGDEHVHQASGNWSVTSAYLPLTTLPSLLYWQQMMKYA